MKTYYYEQIPCYDSKSFGFDTSNPAISSQSITSSTKYEHGALQAQEDSNEIDEASQKFNRKCKELLSKLVQDVKYHSVELSEYIDYSAWNRPLVYCDDDDDEDYTIAITPVLSTEEPDNSLIMENEHLDTIPATESDEFIKSSVEILIPIPSEAKFRCRLCGHSILPLLRTLARGDGDCFFPEVRRNEEDILLIKDDYPS
ncbi:hypothetical protein Tco_0506541 [Tanacetum coccineum]